MHGRRVERLLVGPGPEQGATQCEVGFRVVASESLGLAKFLDRAVSVAAREVGLAEQPARLREVRVRFQGVLQFDDRGAKLTLRLQALGELQVLLRSLPRVVTAGGEGQRGDQQNPRQYPRWPVADSRGKTTSVARQPRQIRYSQTQNRRSRQRDRSRL
jgi:hypothetical protein